MSEDQIYLVDYDPNWPKLFELESARILKVLGNDLVLRIEHIGSTAVVGLTAKPIIDMLVFVHSLENAKNKIADLEALGYAFWHDNPNKARLFFVRGLPPNGPRTHHIHIAEPSHELDDQVIFRDYLRVHSEDAAAYLDLKCVLATRHAIDREEYTNAKTAFISSILTKAKSKTSRDSPDNPR